MATGLPPVPKEQAFLETYFQCLKKFAHDKAKELSDKERESCRLQPTSVWCQLVGCLGHFATSEKAYVSLLFLAQNLGQKFFGRRDTLKTSHAFQLTELRRIEEGSIHDVTVSWAGEENIEQLYGHLCGQLCQYIVARQKMVEFYEQMMLTSQNKCISYGDLQLMITDVIQACQKHFHHPILSPIRTNLMLECEILSHLLLAHCHLQEWEFLPTLFHLNDAHTKLADVAAGLKEVKRIGFSSASRHPLPAVFQWLCKFKCLVVSKFSLYFHETLSKHGPTSEMKGLLAKTSFDFYSRLVTFHKKSDALCLGLILDTNGKEGSHHSAGYHHPQKVAPVLQGIDSYPPIFLYPPEKPDRHWPNVISILTEHSMELDSFDKVIYICDEIQKQPVTYFLTRLEPRITLFIIFEAKKTEKDSYVHNLLNDICPHLRCTKLFAALKPGVK